MVRIERGIKDVRSVGFRRFVGDLVSHGEIARTGEPDLLVFCAPIDRDSEVPSFTPESRLNSYNIEDDGISGDQVSF